METYFFENILIDTKKRLVFGNYVWFFIDNYDKDKANLLVEEVRKILCFNVSKLDDIEPILITELNS